MKPSTRIITNTIAQYSRSFFNILLSLYSTRLIIEALGQSDYGIFVVVCGVISLLGFVTNALVITTQRFLSCAYGNSNEFDIRKVFANSVLFHLIVSLGLAFILYSFKDFFIYHYLTIPSERLSTADIVYQITIGILAVTIMIAPFKALFIARENIVYVSLIEVLDGILKLGVALWIQFVSCDKLYFYALLMLGIQFFNFVAIAGYSFFRYMESRVPLSWSIFDRGFVNKLLGFAGWSTYGMGAVVCRTQGIQLLINLFFGTLYNSAYGIAMQVFGSLSFVSTSIMNAMNPQIIQAEGASNRQRMLHLASLASKYSTLLLLLIIVPLLFELDEILSVWLTAVPSKTSMFCRYILISFIVDQLTYGLNIANLAIGKIRTYSLLMYTPKLLILLPMYYVLKYTEDATYVMQLYLFVEIVVSLARIPYIKHTCSLNIFNYIRIVFLPLLPVITGMCVVSWLLTTYVVISYRFVFTIFISICVGMVLIWLLAFDNEERLFVKHLLAIKKKE